MSEINNLQGDPDGTIPVADAIQFAANWRSYLETSGQKFATHAFLIPIVAFQNILQYNPDAEGVRAYVGLDDATDPTTAKLLLVPVVNGADVPYLPQTGDGGTVNDSGPSNIYDYTRPCPPVCPPPGSILNG